MAEQWKKGQEVWCWVPPAFRLDYAESATRSMGVLTVGRRVTCSASGWRFSSNSGRAFFELDGTPWRDRSGHLSLHGGFRLFASEAAALAHEAPYAEWTKLQRWIAHRPVPADVTAERIRQAMTLLGMTNG